MRAQAENQSPLASDRMADEVDGFEKRAWQDRSDADTGRPRREHHPRAIRPTPCQQTGLARRNFGPSDVDSQKAAVGRIGMVFGPIAIKDQIARPQHTTIIFDQLAL